MQSPRDASSETIKKATAALEKLAAEVIDLEGPGSRQVEAWFLGPKAENMDLLERLVVEAIRDQAYWRRNYHPEDPTHITEEMKRTPGYLQAVGTMWDAYRDLLAYLKRSVPFFSMRYQGHMNWELTMPSIVGYFAAMLYNPNNVAFEGSTATTILELVVGDDLCRMLGYAIPDPKVAGATAIRPWGHITCDGTVANIEAMWSARNLKSYALAVREALRTAPALETARGIVVPHPRAGKQRLVDLSSWETINLPADDVLELLARITVEYRIAASEVTQAINRYSLQTLGLAGFAQRFSDVALGDSAILVSGTKHYSFPKAAALLGLGAANLIDVPVDFDARVDVEALRQCLQRCLDEKRPVVAVVAVIGTTEESAIDPLADILKLREEFALKGLYFQVHADAAWGGYHCSVFRDSYDMAKPAAMNLAAAQPIQAPLSKYAVDHLQALKDADSITVDPHKSGYIPYPAGALCYRNSSMRDLVTFSAPVIFHGKAEPTVGIYGVEGSKPGAAAAAVYLSHRVIRPSREGYGAVIGQALFSCRKLYARLLMLAEKGDRFIVVPLPRLPRERAGAPPTEVHEQLLQVKNLIDAQDTNAIRNDAAAMKLLSEIGPDQNILAYAFNFVDQSGNLNSNLNRANQLNKEIYKLLSIDPGEQIYKYDLIVSTTDLKAEAYGQRFIDHYKDRLGVGGSAGDSVTVLRSVVMDPWITETGAHSFIDVLAFEFRKAVLAAVAKM